MSWKAPLPRYKPELGNAHFIFAMKDSKGGRVELSRMVDQAVVAKVLKQLIDARPNTPTEKEILL